MRAALRIRLLTLTMALLGIAGCESAPPRRNAELPLTPVQASGRDLFVRLCSECLEAYASRAKYGPSLEGVFRKRYLSSGMPANDDRVRDVITLGQGNMPGFGRVLTPQQVDEIIAYLHTL